MIQDPGVPSGLHPFNVEERALECVTLRRGNGKLAGDVDVLVLPTDPEQATAIQIERLQAVLKMGTDGYDLVENGSPERFAKLVKAGSRAENTLTFSLRELVGYRLDHQSQYRTARR